MEKYKPPYDITEKMLYFVSSISEKVGQIDVYNNLDAKPHLRRNNRIKSIHSSLKIEANSLSISQVRDVVDGQLVIGEKKDIQEVKNAYEAYDRMKTVNPYSLEDLKTIHGVLTRYILDEAGVFRQGEEGVFSGDECIFMAPPAKLVSAQMEQLFNWMKENKEKVHPLILSAVFHYEFVFIHPFADGNGRVARLWHSIILTKWKPVFEFIPIESQIEKFQDEYYKAISNCHVAGNSNEFIEFMLLQIDRVLANVILQVKKFGNTSSEYVNRMLKVMEYDVPYTSNRIMEMLGLKSKETFRKNYMKPALDLGLVKMTVPDKPNSRNQRYVRK